MESLFTRKGGEDRPARAVRDAATVILLREPSGEPYEVFLMRRNTNQTFMGGAYVFPGGRLDDADMDPGLVGSVGQLSAAEARRLLQEPDLPETTALGLFLAAIRETFEEAGVLLARDSGGQLVDLADPETVARLAAYRSELHEKRITLMELVRKESLCYAPDLLIPYSHWITPELEPRRFDTRFFLARLPEGQVAVHDRGELTESCWLTPASALAEHRAGRIALMPPTLKTLEELALFSRTEPLFTAARLQTMVTILPEIFRTAEGIGIRLPHDAEYTLAAFKQPPRPGETSRIVMQDGIWKAFAV